MKKLITVVILLLFSNTVNAAIGTPVEYNWGHVAMGAGGLICTVIAHPLEKDLYYTRTDVGGAYRWDKENNVWIPITDLFTNTDFNFYGVDGICIDPTDVNTVYIAAGKYSYKTCDLLKSTDRGKTWIRTNMDTFLVNAGFPNALFDGNGPSRGMGERIAIDPNNTDTIYIGTRKAGLWRTADGGKTFEQVKVDGIVTGDDTQQPRSIVFDKSSGTVDGVTKTLYVGVTDNGVFKSNDGGKTFEKITGTPDTPQRMEVSKSGKLYIASKTGLFIYDNGLWTEISPVKGTQINGVTLDPTEENTIMCIGYSSNIMSLPIMRSTDGGMNWTNMSDSKKITKIQNLQWFEPEHFSSNTRSLLIDPHDPKKVFFTDWHAIWRTDNITADSVVWTNPIWGVEETVAFEAACPPTGKYTFISAVADVYGTKYTDVTQYPTKKMVDRNTKPWLMTCTSISYCEENPSIIAVAGIDHNKILQGGISTNGGETFIPFKNIPGKDTVKICVSSKIDTKTGVPTIVLIPAYSNPYVSADMGQTWTPVNGIPYESGKSGLTQLFSRSTPIAVDKVNGNFYIVIGRKCYISDDGGFNWKLGGSLNGYDDNGTIVKTAPGRKNEVWVTTTGYGLLHSTDGGLSFTRRDETTNTVGFGFGKEAPDRTNPTMYMFGTPKGAAEGMYRSLDMGVTWDRMNDPNLNKFNSTLGDSPNCVEGDRQTFGTVYVGSDGRGYYLGRLESFPALKYYSDDFSAVNADWTLTGMSLQDGSIAGNGTALFHKEFAKKYKYSLKISNVNADSSNLSNIIFNYTNEKNFYFVELKGDGKVSLNKKVNGNIMNIANSNYALSSNLTVNITYEDDGYISVVCNNVKLFNKVRDITFTFGKVGFLANTADIKFDNFIVDNDIISVFQLNLTNGADIISNLESFKGKTVNLECVLKENMKMTDDYSMLIGLYNGNGQLVNTKIHTIEKETSDIKVPVKIPQNADNNYKIKVFYWNSCDDILPLINKAELAFNK